MTVKGLYFVAIPVLGFFDEDGNLVQEIEGPATKLFHPLSENAPRVMAHFEAHARERLAGETPAKGPADPVE